MIKGGLGKLPNTSGTYLQTMLKRMNFVVNDIIVLFCGKYTVTSLLSKPCKEKGYSRQFLYFHHSLS